MTTAGADLKTMNEDLQTARSDLLPRGSRTIARSNRSSRAGQGVSAGRIYLPHQPGMTKTRKMILLAGIIAVVAVVLMTGRGKRTVSLLFRGIETNYSQVMASVEITNSTRHPIAVVGGSSFPDYEVLMSTSQGWVKLYDTHNFFRRWTRPGLPQTRTLQPGSFAAFQIPVKGWQGLAAADKSTNSSFKVVVTYYPAKLTNGAWKYIPVWITQRLPGRNNSYTIESPVFSIRTSPSFQ